MPRLDSIEESSSTDNYDDVHSSQDADSDSTVGSQEIQVTGTHTEEKSSALKENDDELNTSKVAGYPGVDVSEDVFYLLEK